MTFKSRRKKRWEKGMILGAGCFGFLSGVVFTQQNTSPVHASEETVAFIHEDPVSRIITNAKDAKTYQENSVNKIDSMVSMAKDSEITVQLREEKRKEDRRLSTLGILTEEDHIETLDYGVCPNPDSSTKSYMDGSKIQNRASRQWKLIQTMNVNEQGFYSTDDGFIGVALGSYYGAIGTKYLVTLENGMTYKVIKTDEKSDVHVYDGCYHRVDGSVMEMVIDEETAGKYWGMTNGYVLGGNFNNAEEFKGQILDIQLVDESSTKA